MGNEDSSIRGKLKSDFETNFATKKTNSDS